MRRYLSSGPWGARALAELEAQLLTTLRALPHPALPGSSLGALGVVTSVAASPPARAGAPPALAVALDPVFPGAPSAALVEAAVRAACAAGAPAGCAVDVALGGGARAAPPAFAALGGGLARVRAAVAVASGKGGVGKSTVAVNLAFALHARGARAALLDADVQGPSLPTMLAPRSAEVARGGGGAAEGCVNAVDVRGVACASYGWVAPRHPATGERSGAALMRGPMLGSVVGQLAKFTDWGARDALVVDTPPGTGDVHLTLGQLLPFAGAVVVTTPQAVAVADTRRGLDMLARLNIPVLALVLNMAHFDAPDTGARYHPLGSGAREAARLARDYGVPQGAVLELPLEEATSAACDSGVPLVLSHPRSQAARVFDSLAALVAGRLEAALGGGGGGGGGSGAAAAAAQQQPKAAAAAALGQVTVRWDAGRHALLVRWVDEAGAGEVGLAPAAVRRACRCAACVDEHSGAPRLDPAAVAPAIAPRALVLQGNYGVAVEWSDGHSSSIYTLAQLKELALQERERERAGRRAAAE